MAGRPILRALPRDLSVLVFPTSEHMWILLDREGKAVKYGLPPTPELQAATPTIRAPFVGMAPDEQTWAMVFITATPFLVFEAERLRCVGHLVEGTPQFPAAEAYHSEIPVWAIGMAVSRESLYVLARGRTELERQLLDEYSLADCTYRGTLRLPRILQAVAYDGNVFFFYYEDPVPSIIALKTSPGPSG